MRKSGTEEERQNTLIWLAATMAMPCVAISYAAESLLFQVQGLLSINDVKCSTKVVEGGRVPGGLLMIPSYYSCIIS